MKKQIDQRTCTLGQIPSLLDFDRFVPTKNAINNSSMKDFDRFIPSKKSMNNLELQLQSKKGLSLEDLDENQILGDQENQSSGLVGDLLKGGIFSTTNLSLNDPFLGRRLYSHQMLGKLETTRKISKEPFKVLDAPYLQDDFYLNVLDWSNLNVLGVGLGNCVYTWDFMSNQVTKMVDLGEDDLVSAVQWNTHGNLLIVGGLKGVVSIWDANKGNTSL